MRACIVVLALLATPLAIGAAQTPDLPGNSSCDNGNGDETRSDTGGIHAHQGLCGVEQPPPPPPPPPPPGPCGQAPATSGTAMITGQVFTNVAPDFLGLANWCVDLTGTVSGSVATDASGFYTFSGLPAGDYQVCEELQAGWQQTYPPAPQGGANCPVGFGWAFTLVDGATAGMNDFGNVMTP